MPSAPRPRHNPSGTRCCRGSGRAIIRRAAEIIDQRREEIIDWLIHESGSTRIKVERRVAIRARRHIRGGKFSLACRRADRAHRHSS